MSPEDQDLKFWEAAKISNSQPLWTAPWLFDGSKLYICTSEVIEEVLITSTAEIELAIFDVICLFWQTIALMLKTDTYTWTMARYHCDLHDDVSRRLCGGAWKGQHSEIPASLRPWLARTLFMHQHDEESREAFRSVKVPEYLLPFVTTAITSDKKFQHYIEPFVSYILRDMGWKSVGPRRSWEVGFIRELCPRPEHQPSDWKGIAILPIEYALQPWEVYFTHGDIKRQLTKSGTLTSISIYRLRGREWVNDDVINAYVACMPLRDGILVLNSYFANHIKERKKSRIIRNMLGKPPNVDDGMELKEILKLYQFILFPYHVNRNHWITVRASYDQITFMDSLPNETLNHSAFIQAFKDTFTLDPCLRVVHAQVPTQPNTFDCGVYASQFIKFSYFQQKLPEWRRTDIAALRKLMALEIYEGSLRWYA